MSSPSFGSVRVNGWRWWLFAECAGCSRGFWSYLALYRLCWGCGMTVLRARRRARRFARRGQHGLARVVTGVYRPQGVFQLLYGGRQEVAS